MKQTILRFQSGRSDKVWAYSPGTEKSYHGRFGSRLRSFDLPLSKSFAKIQEKLNKGYEDVSKNHYVEPDGTLRDGSLQNTNGDEWTICFGNVNDIETTCNWLDSLRHLKGSLKKERDWLSHEFNSASHSKLTIKKPSIMTIGLLAGVKGKLPSITCINEDGTILSKSMLIELARMSRENLIEIELIKEVKLYNSNTASDQDAFF